MDREKRILEEIVLCFLMEQVTRSQIKKIVSIAQGQYYKYDHVAYYEKYVLPLFFSNIKWMTDNNILDQDDIEKITCKVDCSPYIFKRFLEKESKDFSILDFKEFLCSLIDFPQFITEWNDKIGKLTEVLNAKKEEESFCRVFHESLFQKMGHNHRKILLSNFHKDIVQLLCERSFSFGLPNICNIIKDDENSKNDEITQNLIHIVVVYEYDDTKETVSDRTFLTSMTTYSFLVQLMIDFNINIDLFNLVDDKGNKKRITSRIYKNSLAEFIGEYNKNEKYTLNLKPKPNINKNNQGIYWATEKELKPKIKQLYDIWYDNYGIVGKEFLFSNINSPELKFIINQIFNHNTLTKEELIDQIFKFKNQLCLLHLIIGFRLSEKSPDNIYIRNTRIEDLPYYLLQDKNSNLYKDIIFMENNQSFFQLNTLLFYSENADKFDHIYVYDDINDQIHTLIESNAQYLIEKSFLNSNNNTMIDKVLALAYTFYDSHKKFKLPHTFRELHNYFTENIILNSKWRFLLYSSVMKNTLALAQFNNKDSFDKIFTYDFLSDPDLRRIVFKIYTNCRDDFSVYMFEKLFNSFIEQKDKGSNINMKKNNKTNLYICSFIELINKRKSKAQLTKSPIFPKLTTFIQSQIKFYLKTSNNKHTIQEKKERKEAIHVIKNFLIFSCVYYRNAIKTNLFIFILILKKLLNCISKERNDYTEEIRFSIYYFLVALGCNIDEIQLMKISGSTVKETAINNIILHFYYCDIIKEAVLQLDSKEKDNPYYDLFRLMCVGSQPKEVLKYFEYLIEYSNNPLKMIKEASKDMIKYIPQIGEIITEQSFEALPEDNQSKIIIEEYKNKDDFTSIDQLLIKGQYEIKSVLVAINSSFPLFSSYFYLDNNWFRFRTKFKKVEAQIVTNLINDKNKKKIIFYQMKGIVSKSMSIRQQYLSFEEIFSEDLVNQYSYSIFELCLLSEPLIGLISKRESNVLSQYEIVSSLINQPNFTEELKFLFNRYQFRLRKYKNIYNKMNRFFSNKQSK